MLHSTFAQQGMVVSSHHLASQAGLAVLKEGGNAIEAMIAAASTIAVVYPHMNSIGGDSFWLIVPPKGKPIAIDACGFSGSLINMNYYKTLNYVPHRGPEAAITMAGTVAGWRTALTIAKHYDAKLPLSRLLEDAIFYAEQGSLVTDSQHQATKHKYDELREITGFKEVFLPQGKIPKQGSLFKQQQLAITLKRLAREGLDSFYKGSVAKQIMADIRINKMPFSSQDLNSYQAVSKQALTLQHSLGELYNFPPPTQGLVSLIILGILDQLEAANLSPIDVTDTAKNIHICVEATKLAFTLRDQYLTDPQHMRIKPEYMLNKAYLQQLACQLDEDQANHHYIKTDPGDTVWLGAMDKNGLAVSFIQSIYHEFGSGVVLPETGILWQNRGASFSLDPNHINMLAPHKKPFHTLNPAAARLSDGRTMVYGTMGGDGQPQTQAALFIRYCLQQKSLQEAITLPRWLFGRTWGNNSESLKIENRFSHEISQQLLALGHSVELLPAYSESVGHAGALVQYPNGAIEGAFDPRGNGSAAGF